MKVFLLALTALALSTLLSHGGEKKFNLRPPSLPKAEDPLHNTQNPVFRSESTGKVKARASCVDANGFAHANGSNGYESCLRGADGARNPSQYLRHRSGTGIFIGN